MKQTLGGNVSEAGEPEDPGADELAQLPEDAARYHWVHDAGTRGWIEAATFSFVRGMPQDEVIQRLGDGRAAALRPVSMDEAAELDRRSGWLYSSEEVGVAVVDTIGAWTIVAEPNGWRGADTGVIERVSEGGELISVYWNIEGVTRIAYAIDGMVITAVDALLPEDREGTDPDRLSPLMEDLPIGDHPLVGSVFSATQIAGMSVAGRLTGVWLDPTWAATPRRAVRLPWP